MEKQQKKFVWTFLPNHTVHIWQLLGVAPNIMTIIRIYADITKNKFEAKRNISTLPIIKKKMLTPHAGRKTKWFI